MDEKNSEYIPPENIPSIPRILEWLVKLGQPKQKSAGQIVCDNVSRVAGKLIALTAAIILTPLLAPAVMVLLAVWALQTIVKAVIELATLPLNLIKPRKPSR